MQEDVRSKLIGELALKTGLIDIHNNTYRETFFDENTGTLYCGNLTIPHNAIKNALKFCEYQMNRYKVLLETDKTAIDMYMNYTVAYNAINLLAEVTEKLKKEKK